MPESAKVIFQFNVSQLEALNDLYNAINDVRKQHSDVDIRISSKQVENLDMPFESWVTIAAEASANSPHDATCIMRAANAINLILPGNRLH